LNESGNCGDVSMKKHKAYDRRYYEAVTAQHIMILKDFYTIKLPISSALSNDEMLLQL